MKWETSVPVVESRTLPPDPAVMKGIGLNHSLSSAIADLVDNSLDASATRVLIRLVRDRARLASLLVIDDGEGIHPEDMDRAMTVGGRRKYREGDLGRFGLGLKAASLGQADSLTLLSGRNGKSAGRRWTVKGAESAFTCDVVDHSFAKKHLRRGWGQIPAQGVGTVVRWDHVRAFPASNVALDTDRFLEQSVRDLTGWLGLVFHRMIASRDVDIEVDIEDATTGERLSVTPVTAIDPFGYLRSPRGGYPIDIPLSFGKAVVTLNCHIWPPRSPLPGFRLRGGTVKNEGFYFYRNRRLLQVGGWNGYSLPRKPLQLARIRVDLDGKLDRLFGMNPEKTSVVNHPEGFLEQVGDSGLRGRDQLRRLPDGGRGGFPEVARVWHDTQEGRATRSGFCPASGRTVGRELEFIGGEEPISIRWVSLGDGVFFSVDLEGRRLLLDRR